MWRVNATGSREPATDDLRFHRCGEGQLSDQPDVPCSRGRSERLLRLAGTACLSSPAAGHGLSGAHPDGVYLAHIRTAFALSNGTYGSPRMHRDLVDEGHEIGRHRTARLMRENQLIARQKRRFKRTTDSEHAWPVTPNLVAQDFTADGPDRKWAADISYIWTAEGWLYLAVVLDLFSRRVVGWATSDRLKRDLAVASPAPCSRGSQPRARALAMVTRTSGVPMARSIIPTADRNTARWIIRRCSADAAS
jgi:HTH-like domain